MSSVSGQPLIWMFQFLQVKFSTKSLCVFSVAASHEKLAESETSFVLHRSSITGSQWKPPPTLRRQTWSIRPSAPRREKKNKPNSIFSAADNVRDVWATGEKRVKKAKARRKCFVYLQCSSGKWSPERRAKKNIFRDWTRTILPRVIQTVKLKKKH